MIETVTVTRCICDKCGHVWICDSEKLPDFCANHKDCKSREWNGKKRQLPSHTQEIKFPSPRRRGRQRLRGISHDEEKED